MQRDFRYIQFLRGIAAVLVVYFHTKIYMSNLRWSIDRSFGYAGVDIFFCISGFIVTTTALTKSYTFVQFLANRVTRIYPMYWVALTSALFLFAVFPRAFMKDRIDAQYIIYSYLLIPINSSSANNLGVPFLKVAWTLVLEVYFYGVVAVNLVLGGKGKLVFYTWTWIAGIVIVQSIINLQISAILFYGNPLCLEFLFGCLVAWAVDTDRVRIRGLPAALLATASALAILFLGGHGDGVLRVLLFGVPSACLVFALVSIEIQSRSQFRSHALYRLGAASYSIYLFHPFVLIAARLASTSLAGRGAAIEGATVLASVAIAAVVGVVLHETVETPLLLASRRALAPLLRTKSRRPGVEAQHRDLSAERKL